MVDVWPFCLLPVVRRANDSVFVSILDEYD